MASEGGASAQNKTKALGLAFAFAATLRVVSQYFIGVFWVYAPYRIIDLTR